MPLGGMVLRGKAAKVTGAGGVPPVFGARVRKMLEEQRIDMIRKMKECAND